MEQLTVPHSGVYIRNLSHINESMQKERAAITMCGGLLGECMVMQEVIDYVMTDALERFGKLPWFKFDLKRRFTLANKTLRDNIKLSRAHSKSSSDRVNNVSDRFYDGLRGDIFLMRNATINELNRRKIKYAECVADMIIIDMMLQFTGLRYQSILRYMDNIYPAFYDSWYDHASCKNVKKAWNIAMDEYCRKNLKEDINANEIINLVNGFSIFMKRFRALGKTQDFSEEEECDKIFSNAVEMLKK